MRWSSSRVPQAVIWFIFVCAGHMPSSMADLVCVLTCAACPAVQLFLSPLLPHVTHLHRAGLFSVLINDVSAVMCWQVIRQHCRGKTKQKFSIWLWKFGLHQRGSSCRPNSNEQSAALFQCQQTGFKFKADNISYCGHMGLLRALLRGTTVVLMNKCCLFRSGKATITSTILLKILQNLN